MPSRLSSLRRILSRGRLPGWRHHAPRAPPSSPPPRAAPLPHAAQLGCQDRCIRVVQGSNLEFEGQLDAPVTALRRYIKSASTRPAAGGPKEMIYGTENGQASCTALH